MIDSKVHAAENVQEEEINGEVLEEEDIGKKQQNSCLFIACVLCTFAVAVQNIPMFLSEDAVGSTVVLVLVIVASFIIFLATSCKVTKSKLQSFHLFILLDDIFVAVLAAIVGFIGVLILTLPPGQQSNYAFIVFMSCEFILMAGAWRALLARCWWQKWQVIVGKLSLLLSCAVYLILAAIIILSGFPSLGGDLQDRLKQFFFLYVFGLFTLYIEIYTKITEADGTGNFKYHYSILESDDKDKGKEEERKKTQQENVTVEKHQMFGNSLEEVRN